MIPAALTPFASDLALPGLLALFTGALGLAVGSFLNVVVWRLPRGGSLVSPPSACPGCEGRIRARDNVPVASWMLLKGRCRDCRTPISPRYPLVEAATAVAFAGVFLVLWARTASGPLDPALFSLSTVPAGIALLPALLYLAAISIALTLIDLDTHTLPNRLVLPAYPVSLVLLAAASTLDPRGLSALLGALIGAAALFTFYLLLALAYPRGMGLGDVKLAGVLGLYLGWFGWSELVVGAFAAFILGGCYAFTLLAQKKATRVSGIPFGPWMLLGSWVGILVGPTIAGGYLTLVGFG